MSLSLTHTSRTDLRPLPHQNVPLLAVMMATGIRHDGRHYHGVRSPDGDDGGGAETQ